MHDALDRVRIADLVTSVMKEARMFTLLEDKQEMRRLLRPVKSDFQ